jgi:predicted dehydrogenase
VTQRQFGHKPEVARTLGNTWDPEKFDVEDFSAAFVRFEGGATMIIRTSWAAHIPKNFFGVSILGTEGGVTTEPPALFHTRNGVLADEEYRTLRSVNTNELQMRAFLAALRGDRELPVKEEETMNVQRILNAAYRSAEEGHEVPVED